MKYCFTLVSFLNEMKSNAAKCSGQPVLSAQPRSTLFEISSCLFRTGDLSSVDSLFSVFQGKLNAIQASNINY